MMKALVRPLPSREGVRKHARLSSEAMGRGKPLRHGVGDLRAAEHANLDRGDREVLEDRLDLRADDFRRRIMDRPHSARVLGGKRSDHARAIHAKRGEGLKVGLNSRAAA